ncbi:serine/threonine protein kinase, partial [Amycolatopsis sp. SID8362]|nr:serine/threonine protein kinase [Amycolatopsis sp. SID8362]NED48215.1 serine/threonine protein kinase [Amycolatopsis sp. SID8362]
MGGDGRNLPSETAPRTAFVRENGGMSIEHAAVDLLATGPIATVYANRAAGEAVKVFPGPFDRETLAGLERERKALAATGPAPSILPVLGVADVPGGR